MPNPPGANKSSERSSSVAIQELLFLISSALVGVSSSFTRDSIDASVKSCPVSSTSQRSLGPLPPSAPVATPQALSLEKNEVYRNQILRASERTGLGPAAVASIIDAEAEKTSEGVWKPDSAAQKSSARGLTQFLKGTWIEMARKPGTLLNERAKEQGLIGQDNKVISGKEAELLEFRNDPELSIVTGAEYAKGNLDYLDKQGLIPAGTTDDEKARLAYIAHHEGPSGAKKLLKNTLDEEKAEQLLKTNVGAKKAEELKTKAEEALEDSSNVEGAETRAWAKAYKDWLMGYTEKKIVPDRFRPPKPQTPPQSEPQIPLQQLL